MSIEALIPLLFDLGQLMFAAAFMASGCLALAAVCYAGFWLYRRFVKEGRLPWLDLGKPSVEAATDADMWAQEQEEIRKREGRQL